MTDEVPDPEEILDVPVPEERHTPQVAAVEVWERVLADMEATAEEYADEGWETLQLHPGDVTVVDGAGETDRTGLDVLVPDNEFDRLQSVLADTDVDGYETYRTERGSFVYLLIVAEAVGDDRRVAVLYPAYYDVSDGPTKAVLDRARETGRLRSYLRVLSGDYVEIVHDDPDPLLP